MQFKQFKKGDDDYLNYWFMWLGMFSFVYFILSVVRALIGVGI